MHDVILIGGGVIGLTAAYELASQGLNVAVFDQGQFGQEASWAGAGIIPPGNPTHANSADARLRAASYPLWQPLSDRLRSETGIDNGFRICGGIELQLDSEHPPLADEVAAWQREQVAVERLSADELPAVEPHLAQNIAGAYRLPEMAQVRNPRHVKALLAACAAKKVALHAGTPVFDLHDWGGRIVAVETPAGFVKAGKFIVTSGAWSARLLAAIDCRVPVQPIRGQIVLLNAVPLPFRHIVNVGSRYLVPRSDGRILVGSTEEHAGFDKRNTATAVSGLMEFALRVCPALANATFERAWSGLRPGSADGLPYIGAEPRFHNLYVAAGHFRAGLQLSPITSVLLKELVLARKPSLPLQPYAPDRHGREPEGPALFHGASAG